MKIIHKDIDDNLIVTMTRGDWLSITGRAKLAEYSSTDPGMEGEPRDFGIAEVRLRRVFENLKALFPEGIP